MAYDALEDSIEDGRPAQFFAFTLDTTVWRYTSADVDIVASGQTWRAAAIKADAVKQTGEAMRDALSLDVPSWIGPAQVFMSAAPSMAIAVTIFSKHIGDAEMVVDYIGEITQVNYPLPGRARITCEDAMATMEREGLRLAWQRSCTYALYDPLTCKVNKLTHRRSLTVLAVVGFTAYVEMSLSGTVPDAKHFANGLIEWVHPMRGTEYLPIESLTFVLGPVPEGSANAELLLAVPPSELAIGTTGYIYPACDFTPTTCQTVFSNYDNHGGAPDLPGKSPFDGTPVF